LARLEGAVGLNATFSYIPVLRPHLEHCVQVWSPQCRGDMDLLECIQGRATKMFQGMKHLPCEDRLGELGLCSLEKETLRGELRAACQYLQVM